MRSVAASYSFPIAVLMASCGHVANAQGPLAWKLHCVSIGNSGQMEPLGDREGHAITVDEFACRTEGGPLDGAVYTGKGISEWDKGSAVLRACDGVYRKEGAFAMHDRGEGKIELTMVDGKVTGWVSTNKGKYNVATGTAAGLAGKTWTAISRPTGSNTFTVEVKVQ